MLLTSENLRNEFEQLNQKYFGGRLGTGVAVEIMTLERLSELAHGRPIEAALGDLEHGITNMKDGSLVLINPEGEHQWRCTLVHEMIHAYEVRFGDLIKESDEGRQAAKWCEKVAPFYGLHSAKFFSMLFEIMRSRGHDPSPRGADFSLYFG